MSKEIYSGTVQRVLYAADDFRIVKVVLDGARGFSTVTAKGNFPAQDIQDGSWVTFEGRWVDDRQYGRQLQVMRSPVAIRTWDDAKVVAALSANGVGPAARNALVTHAIKEGLELVDLLDSGDLSKVETMMDFTQEHTLLCWQGLRTYLDGAAFMADAGIPSRVVSKVWETFGTDLQPLITKDPWVLVRVSGITFKEADEIAIRLGLSLDNPGRVRGAVLSSVQEIVREGHSYATSGQIVASVRAKISKDAKTAKIVTALKELSEDNTLKIERDLPIDFKAIYDNWHYKAESRCADLLSVRAQVEINEKGLSKALGKSGQAVEKVRKEGGDLKAVARAALENWAEGNKTTLTEDQLSAALHALTSPVSLLTGLPGTGKTTTLKAVVSIIQDAQVPFLLVAPTGIAAKRMSAVTGAGSSTVHRAFGASGFMGEEEEREATYVGITGASTNKSESGSSGDWEYGPGNPHPARFVVVDESSMLDLHMLYRLLEGTSPECRIMFVGDPYQLPSVGSGDILRDLVKAEVFSHAHLTRIFRQEGTSGIVIAAHKVHAGNPPSSDGKDFILFDCRNEEDAADAIEKIAVNLYGKRKNFQVLSPRHAGEAGVTALNQRLRMALNPSVPGLREMKLAGSVVREGDRIMVVKNNYNLGVYNGDVGKVSRIDSRAKEIEIKIHEGVDAVPRIVTYKFKDATRAIRLAYAQTVHKSQGQEYDVIVLPVLPTFGRQLQRNLFYTAITRAREKVLLVGSADSVARAVRNNHSELRNTLLDVRLRELLGGVSGTSDR